MSKIKIFILTISILLMVGLLSLLIYLLSTNVEKTPPTQSISIKLSTGNPTGNYYLAGSLLSKVMRINFKQHNVAIEVQASDGSKENINTLIAGKTNLTLAQSDIQYQAYYGLGEWKNAGPQKQLRSILSLYQETVIFIATESSGITQLQDIAGKRINLGHRSSGQFTNSQEVLKAFNIDEAQFSPQYLRQLEAIKLMREGELDGMFYTIGHPAQALKNLSAEIKLRIIPIYGQEVDQLLKKYPYYTKTILPADLYPLFVNNRGTYTISVTATLLTTANADEKSIYNITREIHQNLNKLGRVSDLFQELDSSSLFEGLSAPLHSGARKYFKEANMLEKVPSFLLEKE